MTNDSPGSPHGENQEMDVLQTLDSDLNIYALANGMELIRNRGGVEGRVLTWYSDRAERQILISAASGEAANAVNVLIGVGGGGLQHKPPEATQSFREGIAPGELRKLLDEAVQKANALVRPDRPDSAG